jgi:PAP2 superfamily
MMKSGHDRPKRFRAKWIPVRVKKTRQKSNQEPRSDSIGTEKALERADAAVWIAIGVIAMAVMGFALLGPFKLDVGSFLIPGVVTALLAAGGWFYRSIRRDPRLGAILSSTAHIIAFAAVGAPLSYIAATAGFPLQDAALEAIDRHMGVDWTQLMSIVSRHPGLQLVLSFAYASFALQTLTTVLALGIAGQLTRLSSFIAAFVATTLIIIAISAVLPAAGPWLFLDIQQAGANGFLPASATSWPVFLALRDGTLHTVYGIRSEGIITFPSLHAALGVLFPLALWRVRSVRWLAVGLNVLLVIATPAYGSHYVVDVIAGILIAAACWVAVARLLDPAFETRPEHVAAIADSPSIVAEAPALPAMATLSRDFESA